MSSDRRRDGNRLVDELRDRVAFRVCELLLVHDRPLNTEQLAAVLSEEFEIEIKRESIYNLMRHALKRGMIRLVPPLHETMAAELASRFDLDVDRVRVVNTHSPWGQQKHGVVKAEQVSLAAAEWVSEMIRGVAAAAAGTEQAGRDVHLGLGPGHATREIAQFLGQIAGSDPEMPKLNLHAITAGGFAEPQNDPVAFFNLFPSETVAKCTGLFAETLMSCDRFEELKENDKGIGDLFDERNEIQIIITSMGDILHEHDRFRCSVAPRKSDPLDELVNQRGCVGNVQYRPYSATGPIEQGGDEERAVTLFELEDFRRIASGDDGRHVLLVIRPCPLCGPEATPNLEAVIPLLTNPALKIWSEVIVDVSVAYRLLHQPEAAA